MKCIQLNCADGLMLVGYSKIGYRYLFLPPACIRGPAFICPYRPRPGADWPSGRPGGSPVGRRGWDGPKYRPTPLTKRPFPLTSPAPTLFYATQNTYYLLYFQKLLNFTD